MSVEVRRLDGCATLPFISLIYSVLLSKLIVLKIYQGALVSTHMTTRVQGLPGGGDFA